MGEAARQLTPQQIASQLNETRAIKRKQLQPVPKQKNGQVLPFARKEAPTAVEIVSETETQEPIDEQLALPTNTSEQAMAEQLNTNRARTAGATNTLGFDVNVRRLSESGNISASAMEDANARIADLSERARAATTLAELQQIRLDYEALNRELTENALDDVQSKAMEELRAWIWRGISNGGPALDDALGGATFGAGTVAADMVKGWQFMYGRFIRGNPEPVRFRSLFIPPPLRTTPEINNAGARGIYQGVMFWWDMLTTVLLFFVQNGFVILIGATLAILIGMTAYCLNLGPLALISDPDCPTFSDMIGAFKGVISD